MVISNTQVNYQSNSYYSQNGEATNRKSEYREQVKTNLDEELAQKEREKIELQSEINQLHLGRYLNILV